MGGFGKDFLNNVIIIVDLVVPFLCSKTTKNMRVISNSVAVSRSDLMVSLKLALVKIRFNGFIKAGTCQRS